MVLCRGKFLLCLLLVGNWIAESRIVLSDVSRKAGLDYSIGPRKTYGGPSVADLDDDGYPDLIFTHHDNSRFEIYFNQRDGTFGKADIDFFDDCHALNAFRYSPTSRAVHIAMSRGGAWGVRPAEVRLFRVGRDRGVTEVTQNSGTSGHKGRGRSAIFLPLRKPGRRRSAATDMLSTNMIEPARIKPPQGSFRNVGREPRFRSKPIVGYDWNLNWYAAPVDFDNDGRMDVMSFEELRFHKVVGDFKLENVTQDVLPWYIRPLGVVSVAEFDFDNDGKWDLYVGATQTGDLFWRPEKVRDYLFRNVGGRYVDVSAKAGLRQDGQTRGVTAADMDNDGLIDLVISKYWGRSIVLRNLGNGRFARLPTVVPKRLRGSSPADGLVTVDYDLDGRVDVVLAEGDSIDKNKGGFYRLFRNESPRAGRHYLLVRVGHAPSGRATPLHAVVRVRVGTTWMQRRVGAPGVSVSVSLLETVHFGLGKAASADQVIVTWLDGSKKSRGRVRGDRVVTIGRVARAGRRN